MRTPSSVPGEIYRARGTLHHVAAPQRPVAIAQSTSRKMPRRHGGHADICIHHRLLTPIQLGDPRCLGQSFSQNAPLHAQRHHILRFPPLGDFPVRWHVEVIVVIVTLQNHINRGKLVEPQPGRPMPLRPRKRYGTRTFRPDGIRQYIQAVHLDQRRRVPDERDAQSPVAYPFRRR